MLTLNLKRLFALRGIDKPFAFLVKNGFSDWTASGWLNGQTKTIKYSHVEKLCVLLNCEPNDMFEWQATDSTLNTETHPLRKLKRESANITVAEMMKAIPIEKMDEIQNILKEFKDD